jgi:hypothetical protein
MGLHKQGAIPDESASLTSTAQAVVARGKGLLATDPKKVQSLCQIPMYPLRFEPIYQYGLWGGRRLADLLTTLLPGDGPIGEAWILSDRDATITQLLEQSREQLLGKLASAFRRFPLLLKFLDAREVLSVQVHPSDAHKKAASMRVQSQVTPRTICGGRPAISWIHIDRQPLLLENFALQCLHSAPPLHSRSPFLVTRARHSSGAYRIPLETRLLPSGKRLAQNQRMFTFEQTFHRVLCDCVGAGGVWSEICQKLTRIGWVARSFCKSKLENR